MIHRHSLRVLAADLTASLLNVALDTLASRLEARRKPVVASMPTQRITRVETTLFLISEAEREAMIRAAAAMQLGRPLPDETYAVIEAMVERAREMRPDLVDERELFERLEREVGGA